MSGMKTTEEFIESLWQWSYDSAWPWERFFLNRERKDAGLPPLESTWSRRRSPGAP